MLHFNNLFGILIAYLCLTNVNTTILVGHCACFHYMNNTHYTCIINDTLLSYNVNYLFQLKCLMFLLRLQLFEYFN